MAYYYLFIGMKFCGRDEHIQWTLSYTFILSSVNPESNRLTFSVIITKWRMSTDAPEQSATAKIHFPTNSIVHWWFLYLHLYLHISIHAWAKYKHRCERKKLLLWYISMCRRRRIYFCNECEQSSSSVRNKAGIRCRLDTTCLCLYKCVSVVVENANCTTCNASG